MPSKLNEVEFGFNKYCGPSVLSILTGRSTDDCANVISRVTGKWPVDYITTGDLLKAANRLGFETTNMMLAGQSLFRSLIHLAPKGDAMYVIVIPNHFVVVEVNANKLYFCDNHTKQPIPAASSARLMMMVVAAYKVSKRPDYEEFLKPKPEPVKEVEPIEQVWAWQCKECYAYSILKATLIHAPSCKWRNRDSNAKSTEGRGETD